MGACDGRPCANTLLRIHYMYSKCLWKMFCYNGIEPEHRKHLDVNTVLDAFADTIRSLPRKRDSRSEPILEPHYKLASVVHKLVTRGHLTVRTFLLLTMRLCVWMLTVWIGW